METLTMLSPITSLLKPLWTRTQNPHIGNNAPKGREGIFPRHPVILKVAEEIGWGPWENVSYIDNQLPKTQIPVHLSVEMQPPRHPGFLTFKTLHKPPRLGPDPNFYLTNFA
ncbi:hypothetical protein TNIN_423751 [Trichonephila inaurata madagascariensis]|uniref:Uncharacterized protein n=1 Tax=Trichonephila inaurata madagascariensis TaxID=2747483 RepID=A0A8X6Y755_9ARAC|nr:hypothetical protein TNIN_423751 [Trichonephila inaurata madagascariensis]